MVYSIVRLYRIRMLVQHVVEKKNESDVDEILCSFLFDAFLCQGHW